MKRILTSTLLLAAIAAPVIGAAQATTAPTYDPQHPWMVRLRLLNMQPLNHSDAFTALGTNFPSNAVKLNSKWFPEIDFTYAFNEKFSLELVLTYPQRHNVTLSGTGIGSLDHLPPTLMAQYHFPVKDAPIRPYIGAGFNLTLITRENLSVGGVDLDVTRSSFGLAFQIGADIPINDKTFFNIDLKKVFIKTNVKAGGATLTKAVVDPTLLSIGIGFRF